MSRPSRILLYSCHGVVREALADQLSRDSRFSIASAGRVGEILPALGSGPPDLLLLDLNKRQENLGELVREVRQAQPAIKIVVLGLPDLEQPILRCIEAGADGFVCKEEEDWEQLVESLARVLRGEVLCSTRIAAPLFSRLAELSQRRREHRQAEVFKLTPREIEILHLIACDSSNRHIAEQLSLSVYTVKNHVHHILEKLGVADRGAAVRHAYRRGWIRDRRRWLARGVG
nr:transcriptional regulatory protein DegU-like [Nerophis lumbriciformis]